MPLVGGGFWPAFLQVSAAYYAAAVLLHYIVPALVRVRSIQKGQRRPGQVSEEAAQSLGERGRRARCRCPQAGRGQCHGG